MLNRNSTILLAALMINNVAIAALNDTDITTCSNATQNGLLCVRLTVFKMLNTESMRLTTPN